jgi:hypothetical protein
MKPTRNKSRRSYRPCLLKAKPHPLPKELAALVERLAEQVHDGWACQRLKQGWTHGPARNDATKQHPNLVPYPQLTEGDKNLDRQAAVETLRAILAMGYKISKPKARPVRRRVNARAASRGG